jgi:hypothetical protein
MKNDCFDKIKAFGLISLLALSHADNTEFMRVCDKSAEEIKCDLDAIKSTLNDEDVDYLYNKVTSTDIAKTDYKSISDFAIVQMMSLTTKLSRNIRGAYGQ